MKWSDMIYVRYYFILICLIWYDMMCDIWYDIWYYHVLKISPGWIILWQSIFHSSMLSLLSFVCVTSLVLSTFLPSGHLFNIFIFDALKGILLPCMHTTVFLMLLIFLVIFTFRFWLILTFMRQLRIIRLFSSKKGSNFSFCLYT